jgi:hypothetical protein
MAPGGTMKKAVLSLILVFTCTIPGLASKIEFGPMGGMLLCFGDSNSTLGFVPPTNRYSLKLGLCLASPLTKSISILPEICWARKGPTYGHHHWGEDVHFDYLEIALPIAWRVGGLPIDIYAGPYYGFLLRATPLYQDSNQWDGAPLPEKLRNWDFGASFGLRFYNKGFFVEIQENLGLINVLIKDPDPNPNFKNSVLALNIGFLF